MENVSEERHFPSAKTCQNDALSHYFLTNIQALGIQNPVLPSIYHCNTLEMAADRLVVGPAATHALRGATLP